MCCGRLSSSVSDAGCGLSVHSTLPRPCFSCAYASAPNGARIARPFWRDWLRLAVRTSLLTDLPRNAKGTALNRVPEDSEAVSKPELGTKRLCAHCSAKFYDLNQAPMTCPKCGRVSEGVQGVQGRSRWRTEARAPVREVKPETHEAEFVPLEDADAEAQGKKKLGEAVEAGDEVELDDESLDEDESLEEDTFIADNEEEDTDVADILGGDKSTE